LNNPCIPTRQIPEPLTEEAEAERRQKEQQRKKAVRKARQEAQQTRRQEEERQAAEERERQRFLALSDREKVGTPSWRTCSNDLI